MGYSLGPDIQPCQRGSALPPVVADEPLHAEHRLSKSALSARAYTALKCMILDQEIAPGSRVAIDVLAMRLGVSPTPVREALARLEGDGLVVRESNGRLYAAGLLDRAAFEQLYQMRLLLEPAAAELAASEHAPAELSVLGANLAAMNPQAAKRSPVDYVAFVGADAAFHEMIARIGQNRFLCDAVHHLHSHHRLAFLYRDHGVSDWRIARREHEAIVAAIGGRDPEGAREAMRGHIVRSRAVLRCRFADTGPSPAKAFRTVGQPANGHISTNTDTSGS